MRQVVITIILFITFVFSAKGQSYYTYVDSADAQIQRKDWLKAEQSILGALREEPANYNNSLLLSNLATLQRRQGRNKEAINNYSIALNMTPNAVTLLNNRGTLYFEVDSLKQAEQDFAKVIELDEHNIDARYYYALIAIEQGDLSLAKSTIDQITKINSKAEEGKIAIARWNQASGNYLEAISGYTDLIKNRVELDWLFHRGECYLRTKNLINAMADINDALKIDPSMGFLYLLKAQINKLQYQNDDMINNMELAVKYGVDRKYAQSILELEK